MIKFITQLFADPVVNVMLFGVLFGDYALSGTVSFIMIIPGVLINILASSIARKKGLRFAYILSIQIGLTAMFCMTALLFAGANPGVVNFKNWGFFTILFTILYAIGRYFSSAPASLVLTMGADITDYETSMSGRYLSGMIGTIFSFTDSIASSFAPMVIGWVLAFIGFNKAYPTADTPLTPQLRFVTILLFTIIPIVAIIFSLFLMRYYKLDSKTMVQIQEKIHTMKAAADVERAQAIAKNVPLSDMDYVDLSQYPIKEEEKEE